jgi:hypothetical protein
MSHVKSDVHWNDPGFAWKEGGLTVPTKLIRLDLERRLHGSSPWGDGWDRGCYQALGSPFTARCTCAREAMECVS